ncbi:sortase [Streptococcus moroccensis]|uniref:Sortase A n=1 Tax=Streptococcus moroccensis TaxID=1451356 RepID=A0ABT9YTV3_9STRE|nr:sortase [Streptococcus moroccensis]MDQ0223424.1 sortase A [Streptococcus moroccensis]
MKRLKPLKIFLRLASLACFIGAGWFFLQNTQEAKSAHRVSQRISNHLQSEQGHHLVASENGAMPVQEIDGTNFIGRLKIPSHQLVLPIAANYSFNQLYQTPTRYQGSYYTNDLVICAHNYPEHFEGLQTIALGEEVQLETVDGQEYRYLISNREYVEPTNVDSVYKQGVTGDDDWDLTLFTCTPAGLKRVIIRCERIYY